MILEPGQELLHYRIVEKIGQGGMGEVWKAVDTTLDRELALKFIPEVAAGDTDRLARLEREAKMLATLNHPNIAAIYGYHAIGDRRFIAMEYVPGEDLAERLARGPLAVEDAVDVGRQVADALEAAHEQGVIHRDLKPANIKRTPDGKIKVLDLGLAKAFAIETSADPVSVSLSPTATSAGTVAGVLLGTAAYMSPEQAKGRPVDRRTDIWAFGVVLVEMLTGKKLFDAETVSETLAAVLRDDVPVDDLPADTPASVRSLIRRCLDRDPRTRLRDIGEARVALGAGVGATVADDGTTGGHPDAPAGAPRPPSPRGLRLLPWALVAALALVAAFALWRAASAPAGDGDLVTLTAPFDDDLRLPSNQEGVLALSPDGKTLAVVLRRDSTSELYVRKLDSASFREMPGTEGASTPFFSPDGAWIAFFADDKLKKIPVEGGAPVTLCESDGNNRGADWGTDDMIVFAPHYTRPLMRVSGAGGEPTVLAEIDKAKGERTHRWPQAVPGEDLILFTVGTMDSPESYDDARIEAIRPSTGERRTVLERASMARYVPSGHLVFGREGFLFAVPFDIDRLEVLGGPVPVLEGVRGMRSSGVVHVGFAGNGVMAYIPGSPRSLQSRMTIRGRDGSAQPVPAPPAGYVNPRISPDRTQVALQVAGDTSFDIWTYSFAHESTTRLTFEGLNTTPVWSPDGRRIAFSSVRNDALMSVYVTAADGSGQAELLISPERFENAGQTMPRAWTPDGSALVFEFTNENANNIAMISEADGEVQILLETPAAESNPAISPNGRWMAYVSDEADRFQVFVRAFPGPGGKWQVSTDGGVNPTWSPDGTELFYRWQGRLYAVDVDDRSGGFRTGRPEALFDGLPPAGSTFNYDVLDAGRFLIVESVGDSAAPKGVTVKIHWLADLARRVPN